MFRAFTQFPRRVIHPKTGEVLPLGPILDQLASDVELITDLTEWELNNDATLLEDLSTLLDRSDLGAKRNHNAKLAQELGIRLPDWVREGRKSGNSRLEHIYQARVISEAKSWLERVRANNGVSEKWVSSGWKRTANSTAPTDLTPKMSLSAGAVQYAQIVNNPFQDQEIHLKLVVNGEWLVLIFNLPERFNTAKKITLPDITIREGQIQFNFTAETPAQPISYSTKYILGVDVGVNEYITLSVVDIESRAAVYSCGVSRSLKSLANSITATQDQIKHLNDSKEKTLQRMALSRKRKELAIQTAQEIVELSRVFDNALIVFEDLSHVKNTMRFGRWNRGELLKWVNHYLSEIDAKVYTINPAYTSQDCSMCGSRGTHSTYSVFKCATCGLETHRDVNASINIATRFLDKQNKMSESTFKKVVKTQARKQAVRNPHSLAPRLRGGSRETGHSRSLKNRPTPRQVKRSFKGVKPLYTRTVMRNMLHTVMTGELHSGSQDSRKATLLIQPQETKRFTIKQE